MNFHTAQTGSKLELRSVAGAAIGTGGATALVFVKKRRLIVQKHSASAEAVNRINP